jgi:hypothetical protein
MAGKNWSSQWGPLYAFIMSDTCVIARQPEIAIIQTTKLVLTQ